MKLALWIGGGLIALIAAVGAVFVIGMRTGSPRVLGAIRRMNRAVMNPYQMRSAGKPGAYASIVRHTGRRSGRAFQTPVVAFPSDEGFVIVLPYGTSSDWLRNVMASGTATIVHEGAEHQVDRPEVLPVADAPVEFPPRELRSHRTFGVDQCVVLHRAAPAGE